MTGPDDTWREVGTVSVDGVGAAVRASGVQDVTLPEDAGVLRVVLMQTIVPLPDHRALLLTCSSPVLPLTDALLDTRCDQRNAEGCQRPTGRMSAPSAEAPAA